IAALRNDDRFFPAAPLESCHMVDRSPSGEGRDGRGVPARRVTQPRRLFGPDELAEMDRNDRRRLVHVLVAEGGAHVAEFNSTAGYDELALVQASLWSTERIRVRIFDHRVEQADLDRLGERMTEAADASAVCIAAVGVADDAAPPPRVLL